ncbi:MAG: hypothetical protein IT289_07775 [Oligoflexia bacterium]|nr:hypothetical protein [Oligoflexia bacterium]
MKRTIRSLAVFFYVMLPWLFSLITFELTFQVLNKYPSLTGVRLVVAALFSILIFVAGSAALSRPFHKKIQEGQMKRDILENKYLFRAIYGRLWINIFYFKPLYVILLSTSFLKSFLFRSFGYKGQTDFNMAPDAWIRDLPLLTLEKSAYVANRATLGTNICLSDGKAVVGPIRIGENSLVGHLAIVGLGAKIGKQVDLGVRGLVGIRSSIEDYVKFAGNVTINHGSKIGEKTRVGAQVYVGLRSTVGPNLTVPSGCIIPDGKTVTTQSEVDAMIDGITKSMKAASTSVESILAKFETSHG